MADLKRQANDPSLTGLFHAIGFQIAGIAIAFMANSVNYAFLLFADTSDHEVALSARSSLLRFLQLSGVMRASNPN